MMEPSETQELSKVRSLRVHKKMKERKPVFKRQESWRYRRVKENWRKPRGVDSKMRKKVKGWPRSPSVGYRGLKEVRGLHPSGYWEILVHNVDEVDKINPEEQVIRIGRTVGAKKRIEIAVRAKEKGIRVLNLKEEGLGVESEEPT